MNAALTEYQDRKLTDLLSQHALASRIAQICKAQKLPVYLGGGSARDLLLDAASISDLDIYIEGSQERSKAAIGMIESAARELQGRGETNTFVDLQLSDDVAGEISQFDLTVNAVAIELNERQLVDPTGRALIDIKKRELHPTALALFITNPPAPLRLFRFSLEKGLTIPESTKEIIRRFSPLIAARTSVDEPLLIAELLRILSHNQGDTLLQELILTGVLERTVPELSLLELRKNPEPTVSLLTLCQNLIESLPPELSEHCKSFRPEKVEIRGAANRRTAHIRYSLLGLLKLFLLLTESLETIQSLPGSEELFKDSVRKDSAARNFFQNAADRLVAAPALAKTISQLTMPYQLYAALSETDSLSAAAKFNQFSLSQKLLGLLAYAAKNSITTAASPDAQVNRIVSELPSHFLQAEAK